MLKLSEVYTSMQGEGPNTGTPTQFVRLAGCNMRCAGWPCDTPQAIFPEFYRDEWEDTSVDDLFRRLDNYPKHATLTGGEPFLHTATRSLLDKLRDNGYGVDIFTNGSFAFPEQIQDPSVTIIMDWKLRGSGEATTGLETRKHNKDLLLPKDAVKFVVTGTEDLYEAKAIYEGFAFNCQIWVGAAWGHIDDRHIVDFVLEHKLPWQHNLQQHKVIWDPQARYT